MNKAKLQLKLVFVAWNNPCKRKLECIAQINL